MIEILNVQDKNGYELMNGRYDVLVKLPDNCTNGDVIMAMFPECCSNMGNLDNGIVVDFIGDLHTFNKDWWNAPYKKEVEE